METVKRGGWHLAIQLVSKLVREWDLYMYKVRLLVISELM